MKAIRWTDEQLSTYKQRNKQAQEDTKNKYLSATADKMTLAPASPFVVKPVAAKPNKYRNKKDGPFASRLESKRARELLLLASAGAITDLEFQPRYELIPAQYVDGKCVERAVHYVADFRFIRNGKVVVQDAKGMKTPVYILKRKLLLYVHNIRVEEV